MKHCTNNLSFLFAFREWCLPLLSFGFLFVCMFVYSHTSNISAYLVAVTIAGDKVANFCLCLAFRAFEQGGIFIVPYLLQHETSVYTISSKRPAPTPHSAIQTPDARIIRSLCPTL
jgi:hypothetical protein